MREAVVVSTARTGFAKSGRGSLNANHPITYAGHALSYAIQRAEVDPGEIEDVVLGSGRKMCGPLRSSETTAQKQVSLFVFRPTVRLI